MKKILAKQFDLLSVPLQMSPRLAWIKKHDVHTHKLMSEDGWIAWQGEINLADIENQCHGETEDDAIAEWARSKGLRMWNEL